MNAHANSLKNPIDTFQLPKQFFYCPCYSKGERSTPYCILQSMKFDLGSLGFKMLDRAFLSIVQLDGWQLELGRQLSIHNFIGEQGIYLLYQGIQSRLLDLLRILPQVYPNSFSILSRSTFLGVSLASTRYLLSFLFCFIMLRKYVSHHLFVFVELLV